MRTRLLTTALIFTAALAGCANVDMSRYIHAPDVNVPPRSTETSSQAATSPVQKTKYDPLPAAFGVGPNCYTGAVGNFGGMLVYGGRDGQDRYYSCKPGAPIRFASATSGFNSALIPHLCDISKPVIQTPGYSGSLTVTCTYKGPEGIPTRIQGVPVLVVK
jgi:hypothetical protein